jgi:hypothetical protein
MEVQLWRARDMTLVTCWAVNFCPVLLFKIYSQAPKVTQFWMGALNCPLWATGLVQLGFFFVLWQGNPKMLSGAE